MSSTVELLVGVGLGAAILPLVYLLLRAFTVQVEDEEAVLVTRFGRLDATYRKPGLQVVTDRMLPWVGVRRVSLRRDYRHLKNVHVNDVRGTTLVVDLWFEFRITDPAKALFSVADWEESLHNLVIHAASSVLAHREFREILHDRSELGARVQADVAADTARWGVEVDLVFVRNVSLLPEVARRLFDAVAARLERAKAAIDERGRIAVAELEARTDVRIAELIADAKGQYPLAVGRALAALKSDPALYTAYNELYELSVIRPHRTVAFRGFGNRMTPTDAAMFAPVGAEVGPLLTGRPDQRFSSRR
jgi:regulator of protease activity HflC (stomatin/prohibitin superfamily)